MTEQLYRIGEAARLLELEAYVLRYWETEFSQLEPLRTPKGQRLYTATHLDLLKRVKTLLYEDGLTIGGARKALLRESDPEAASAPEPPKVLRPASPARFVQGTLLPRPVSEVTGVKDAASRRLLQELRTELCNLQDFARNPDSSLSPSASTNVSPDTNKEPPV